jgi:hypothetical protein
MRSLARLITSWVAIYAVALHVILLGLAPIATNGDSLNPVAVICHSVTSDDGASGNPGLAPGHACEHCNLCTAAAPPEPGIELIGALLPSRLLQVLRPAPHLPRRGIVSSPKLARGPPRLA